MGLPFLPKVIIDVELGTVFTFVLSAYDRHVWLNFLVHRTPGVVAPLKLEDFLQFGRQPGM